MGSPCAEELSSPTQLACSCVFNSEIAEPFKMPGCNVLSNGTFCACMGLSHPPPPLPKRKLSIVFSFLSMGYQCWPFTRKGVLWLDINTSRSFFMLGDSHSFMRLQCKQSGLSARSLDCRKLQVLETRRLKFAQIWGFNGDIHCCILQTLGTA